MNGAQARLSRRQIRRAVGSAAADPLIEMQQFLLLQYSFWGRLRWLLTGKF